MGDKSPPKKRGRKKGHIPKDEHRCAHILDIETGRRCRACKTNGEEYCNFHGSKAAELQRKGGQGIKTLWEERKAKAALLPISDWNGYEKFVRALIVDELIEGDGADRYAINAFTQRLEKALEKTTDTAESKVDVTIRIVQPDED